MKVSVCILLRFHFVRQKYYFMPIYSPLYNTFTSLTDAQGVLYKRNHVLSNQTLTVEAVKKKKPRPKRPVDPTCLFLEGMPDGTNTEMLDLFLESCTGKEESPSITYGEKPGTAMVTYTYEIEGR